MPCTFEKSPGGIPGPVIIRAKLFPDSRGWFVEAFQTKELLELGIPMPDFSQFNIGKSNIGVVRGMHYQLPPHDQGKLVIVIEGEAYDVFVDLRKGSKTYGKFYGVRLGVCEKAGEAVMLWIPRGFAHGFMSLKQGTILQYLVTGGEYAPESEGGLRWDDPELGIEWPIPENGKVIVHERDAAFPNFSTFESPFTL